MPPQPPKRKAGKIVGLGCLGVVALFIIIGIIGAATGSGSSNNASKGTAATHSTTPNPGKAKDTTPTASSKPKTTDKPKPAAKPAPKPKPKPKVVTFKVWGTAPAGALGGLDITYGSDSDNRQGHFSNGKFEATLPLNDKAMYYTVTAQLQGSGDIHCSVTVDGQTKQGHASGGYNICDAQLSGGLFGGWD
jgi:hypothetical protein